MVLVSVSVSRDVETERGGVPVSMMWLVRGCGRSRYGSSSDA